MRKYYYNLGMYFEDIVQQYGSNIAIKYDDKTYSYLQLNNKANQFVQFLLDRGIKQGDVIAIANTKTINSFALMIACLKLGVIYVNIDIDGPFERLEKIFKTCEPKIVLSDDNTKIVSKVSESMGIKYLKIDIKSLNAFEKDFPKNKSVKDIDGNTVAYIMFTSGSTGIPKGAAISHQNLIHLINWSRAFYRLTDNDIFANVSPMYFDNSVFDFYSALFSGASFVPIKKDMLTNPLLLTKFIDEQKCTIWFSVPSMLMYLLNLRSLNKNNFKYVRIIAFGGEGYPKIELKKLYTLYKHKAEIFNVYGPTECTCICSAKKISKKDFDNITGLPALGHLNQNFSYLILDERDNETQEGELCLIGPNIGSGYYNDSDRTNSSFVDCKVKTHFGKKMYRTGDIVQQKNGELFFKGRLDNQIKHMGYRIELEEIETAFCLINGINRSAVIYNKNDNAFGKIIAFVSVEGDVNKEYILSKLSAKIPDYMIPSQIHLLNSIPTNKNGKLDKKSLVKMIV
jgi:D-alanine--poly(phosphoribitol) ligase subunit 1